MVEKIDPLKVNYSYETFTVVASTVFQFYIALLEESANSNHYTHKIRTLKLLLIILR